ncbi:winged helix-turn-helix transcriptional regulator [Cryptosporangium phraense]|uniref:Winged helix-turn-helix transcriptional regulator n=1 Tax=Cryptosporangium phraense TaxID=2593070 RepID=A0A545AN27_9ACTN|nr:winged helix-turn-helix transcriptional regulator [Cryptosporangium phraense]
MADVDVAFAARLLADPSRSAMLTLLLDGRAHPAGALARAAGIGRPAASAHLKQLVEAGYVEVVAQGRHRYHRIARPEVALAVESLALIAPPVPVRSLKQSTAARRLAAARTCYDHLAGRAGVRLRDALVDHGVVAADNSVPPRAAARLAELHIPLDALQRARRPLVRECLDWTERRPHLAGALPAALLDALVGRRWLVRGAGRHVEVGPSGWGEVLAWLGCPGPCHALTDPSPATGESLPLTGTDR